MKRNPKIEIDNVPSGAAITMPMLCNRRRSTIVNVRTALKLAIDREEIIKKIAFGTAIPGNDVHVSPNMPYWADLPQRKYDPDQAKSLLKKAGMENLKVELTTADSVYSGAVDMCVLYSEQAKKAGIDISVKRAPNDGYYSDVWLKHPFCMVQWGARPDAGPDVQPGLQGRRRLERELLAEQAVQRVAVAGQSPSSIRPSARPCTVRCRSWHAMMAAPSFRCSRTSSMHETRR